MKKTTILLLTIVTAAALILGACNLPKAESQEDADATTIAGTAAAVFTHAAETAAALAPSATVETPATVTAIPTNTLFPTQVATATATAIPCNRASFVKDVSYPDNTTVEPGVTFTKTWRLKNLGSCTWTSGYVLLLDSYTNNEKMGAPATAPITSGSIAPGETVDISVNLTAPTASGTYQGNFKLRSPDNIVFGINADGQGPFWVKVVVPSPTATPTTVPSAADLIITDITFNPNPPTQGQNVTVSVTVYNQGSAAAGAFKLDWYGGSNFPSPSCSWNIDSLVGKGGYVKTCTYQYVSWYSTIISKAVADSGGSVAESNETNNEGLVSIEVLKQP